MFVDVAAVVAVVDAVVVVVVDAVARNDWECALQQKKRFFYCKEAREKKLSLAASTINRFKYAFVLFLWW